MTKHLFLEGTIQTGKSTLLRKMLAPYMNEVGGFSSQRLTDETGRTIAFRIVPAQATRLTTPYEDTPESIFRIVTDDVKGLNKPEIFESEGLKYLTGNHDKKLILLDEIGGIELRNDAFREELFRLLKGDIPCIGVIKQEQKAGAMKCLAGKSGQTMQHNRQLRDFLANETDSKIVEFSRDNDVAEHEIKKFLAAIFE